MMCRGLIVDIDGNIIARPFKKFFNIEEYGQENFFPLPTGPFKVYDKLDGSLGILYHTPDGPALATRGSFDGEQAIVGTEILKNHLKNNITFLPKYTYLFEIIYPENRIVLSYGQERKLVLLSVRITETGEELPLDWFSCLGFELPTRYDYINDYTKIREVLSSDNKEGTVVVFESGERLKIKFDDYVRLHKLVVGVNRSRIWEILSSGGSLDSFAQGCPDEIFKDINELKTKILDEYQEVEKTVREDFRSDFATRKEAATYFLKCTYPQILFAMLDGKKYDHLIWKQIEK